MTDEIKIESEVSAEPKAETVMPIGADNEWPKVENETKEANHKDFDDPLLIRMVRLRLEGKTWNEIAHLEGVRPNTVWKWRKEYDLDRYVAECVQDAIGASRAKFIQLGRKTEDVLEDFLNSPEPGDRKWAADRVLTMRAQVADQMAVTAQHIGKDHTPKSGPILALAARKEAQRMIASGEVRAADVAPATQVLTQNESATIGETMNAQPSTQPNPAPTPTPFPSPNPAGIVDASTEDARAVQVEALRAQRAELIHRASVARAKRKRGE